MKVLIALLVTLMLGVAGIAAYYFMAGGGSTAASSSEAESSQSSTAAAAVREKEKPQIQADIVDNLVAAAKMNDDTVAWLMIPGTKINDSVLQSIDNWYYLRRNEKKSDDIYGCYFADYECQLGEREVFAGNTVIYGHSDLKDNKEGPKFSELFRFTELAFAEKTPYIYLTTADEKMTWQIFSVFYTDTDFNYIDVLLEPSQVKALAIDAQRLSLYDYGVKISGEDKLLTLSTCSVKYKNDGTGRFVVMARLMPEGAPETPPVLKVNEKLKQK
ncbi:MAG: class B sortase [Hydrogenoanaerobacterium sp.]